MEWRLHQLAGLNLGQDVLQPLHLEGMWPRYLKTTPKQVTPPKAANHMFANTSLLFLLYSYNMQAKQDKLLASCIHSGFAALACVKWPWTQILGARLQFLNRQCF